MGDKTPLEVGGGPASGAWGAAATGDAASSESLFARLAFIALASSEPSTESSETGPGDLESMQRSAHLAAFDRWMELGLAAQRADLEAFASAVGTSVETVLATCLRPEWQDALVPEGALDPDRLLFFTDLDILYRRSGDDKILVQRFERIFSRHNTAPAEHVFDSH